MKFFTYKKFNNTTRIVSLFGIELYKTEESENARIQKFLGNFIYTQKIKSNIKERKLYKIFGISISKRIIENDICSYYIGEKLITQNHLAKIFFDKNLKNLKF